MTQTASLSLRTLGNSDLELTPIGIGTWAIGGGDWASSWGPQDDADSIAAIHRAVDLGVNWIDTAAIYGLGHSEEMVGRAVKSLSRTPSNFSVEQMKRAMKIAPITSLQPPYSMLRRAIETEILPFTLANGIGVINYSPMVSGLLTGKMTAERAANLAPDDWRRRNKEF